MSAWPGDEESPSFGYSAEKPADTESISEHDSRKCDANYQGPHLSFANCPALCCDCLVFLPDEVLARINDLYALERARSP